jgi:hypothetical protein
MTNLTIGCITQLTDGGVSQSIYDVGHAQRIELRDIAARHLEEAIKAKLVELGWTPPGEARKPLTPDELADKCEAWLQAGGASNIVDAYEAGYRSAEREHSIKETP